MSAKLKVESKKLGNCSCLYCLLFVVCCLLSCGEITKKQVAEVGKADSLEVVAEPVKIESAKAEIIAPSEDDEIVVLTEKGITLTEIKTSTFPDASIELETKVFDEGANQLSYKITGVEDFKVGVIENNYLKGYEDSPNFKKEFLYGNNVFLSFLTHENNIAVKTNSANELKNVVIGDMDPLFDMRQPHLLYHLPREQTANPVLDFCLVNASLSKEGVKVKAEINGVEFVIEKWAAYQISGLNKTENSIRIQLIDNNGNLIDGPFNDSGERSFNIEETAS